MFLWLVEHAYVLFSQESSPGTNITGILTLVSQIGLSGVFLWQWYDATKERRKAQDAIVHLIERFAPVLEEATHTLERVQQGMIHQVERADHPNHDMAATLRRLEGLTDDLDRTMRRGSLNQR